MRLLSQFSEETFLKRTNYVSYRKETLMQTINVNMATELGKSSLDCSFILTHLIRQDANRTDSNAKNILETILDIHSCPPTPTLKAYETGWYSVVAPNVFNPSTYKLDGSSNSQAVCFTESTLAGLKAHRNLFNSKYGIAFDRDNLLKKGANPCLNINERLFKQTPVPVNGERYDKHVYNFITNHLHPFINIISDSFDATHEREWRFPGDLMFQWNEIKFVFCPEQEFHIFAKIQSDAMPCLFDLAWLDRV